MNAIRALGEQTFASLKIRNYRLFFIGRGFSHMGNWMQMVALGWLVLEVTGSGVALGSVLALKFLPLLLAGPFAGIVVDRFDKRHILYLTQSILALISLLLSLLVYTSLVELWVIYVIAFASGVAESVDNPTRQTFLHEMVGPENLRNAVTLSSTEANLARSLGPLFAGALIAGAGIAFCFFINALSFLAVIAMLTLMRGEELHREAHEDTARGFLDGIRYVASQPLTRTVLISMALVGTLSYEFQTSLPLLAHTTFLGGAADYAALMSAMGAGSVAGGLLSASRKSVGAHEFVFWAFLFGVSICVAAVMPSLSLAISAMVFVGFFSICLSSTGNTMIQLESPPHMRGRVMSLWSMAIFGSTLIGAPTIGFIGEYVSPRWALALGGVAAILAALFAARYLLKVHELFSIPAFISIRREEAAIEDTKV